MIKEMSGMENTLWNSNPVLSGMPEKRSLSRVRRIDESQRTNCETWGPNRRARGLTGQNRRRLRRLSKRDHIGDGRCGLAVWIKPEDSPMFSDRWRGWRRAKTQRRRTAPG